METISKPCVIFSGGGTSGHIYPALAIAKALQKAHPEVDILFCGTKKGLEADVIPKHGFRFVAIEAKPFSFRPGLSMWRAWRAMKRGEKQCLDLFKQEQVAFVVGTGGYVCAPLISAAAKRKIPIFLHEQNAYPGRSNRLMARHAKTVFLGCKAAQTYFSRAKAVVFTGNPVREEFFALAGKEGMKKARHHLGLPLDAKVILLCGGSLGARKINQSILDFLQEESLPEQVHLILATGQRLYEETMKDVSKRGLSLPACVHIRPYLENMQQYMAAADLVVSRAGASTCAELDVLHKPAVLIPYPYAAGNHQYVNAKVLADLGLAQLCLDMDWNVSRFKACLTDLLLKPEVLDEMSHSGSGFAKANSLDLILSVLEQALPQLDAK